MNLLNYRFTDKELKNILSQLHVVVDTREKRNEHILAYFQQKKIPFRIETKKTGDYSALIPKFEEFGILRDIYLPGSIERKNSINELVESVKDRTRFENELIRSTKNPFVLMVEDGNGYERMIRGQYRSSYNAKSLLASLKTFESRYDFNTVFVNEKASGNFIYHTMYYQARELFKKNNQ